jgi:hypothetical protein
MSVEESPEHCSICGCELKDCGHTEEERKKFEEDISWELHRMSLEDEDG